MDTQTHQAPRILLKNLREAMAENTGPQERLDKIVKHIAAAMNADVCSVYILRADDVLELFATHGFKPEAVHQSQLKVGQGLVGKIARRGQPINVADAQTHPSFAYQPEIGEKQYHALLGVPMLRAGRTLGVLVVRRKSEEIYPVEDIESLETAAMVLSDLVASGDLKGLTPTGTELDLTKPLSQNGLSLSPGIAIGKVVLHDPRVVITNLFNDDAKNEQDRLHNAIQKVRKSFDAMVNQSRMSVHGEHVDVLESLRMFANDQGWIKRIEAAIDDGLTAEAATEKVALETRANIMRSPSPYIRERLNDLDDLARRLLRELIGETQGENQKDDEPFVVVTKTMTAAELFDYDRKRMVGLVIEDATATSHVIIVARALGIAVVRVRDIVARCENNDAIIADGEDGSVHLRAGEGLRNSYKERIDFRAERVARFDAIRKMPSETQDGVEIKLLLNSGLSVDLPQLEQTAADGIGLFRTELQFMVSSSLPRVDEQAEFYKSVLDAADQKPVTFRTLDIGGDKILPYLKSRQEDNPALGWRAIRLSIDRPALLMMQYRALLKAAIGRNLKVKLPMVTTIQEVNIAKNILKKEIDTQKKLGHELPESIKLGVMIEVPNLLWQLDELVQEVDFVSVGSNDLFQYFTASDRTDATIANRYDPMSKAFLRALRHIAEVATKNKTPFHLCGEMAGEPISALALIGLGYRAISMAPGSVGPVKEMVRAVDAEKITKVVNDAVNQKSSDVSVRDAIKKFAKQNNVPI